MLGPIFRYSKKHYRPLALHYRPLAPMVNGSASKIWYISIVKNMCDMQSNHYIKLLLCYKMNTIRDEFGGGPQNFCTFDTPYHPCFTAFLRKNFRNLYFWSPHFFRKISQNFQKICGKSNFSGNNLPIHALNTQFGIQRYQKTSD